MPTQPSDGCRFVTTANQNRVAGALCYALSNSFWSRIEVSVRTRKVSREPWNPFAITVTIH